MIDVRLGVVVFLDAAAQSSRVSICAERPFQSLLEVTSRSISCDRFWARNPANGRWMEFDSDALLTVFHDQYASSPPFTVCIRGREDASPNSSPPANPSASQSAVRGVSPSTPVWTSPVQTVMFQCATAPESFRPFVSVAQMTHGPLAISIADMCERADIWERIKRHVLQHSIMKGRVVQLVSPFRSFSSLSALLEDCRTSAWHYQTIVEFKVHVEFEQAPLSDLLAHLDQLRKRAKQLQLPLFDQRLIEDLAWTSDAIEGTTVPKCNVAHIASTLKECLGDTVEPSVDSDDVIELKNHLMTIEQAITPFANDTNVPIDCVLACRLHHQLNLTNIAAEQRGQYRSVNVTIGSIPDPGFSRHGDVPNDMVTLDDWLSVQSCPNDIAVIARHHYRWVQVHPFIDGNGRVARLLSNCLALRGGWPMFAIDPRVREHYYLALRAVRKGDNDVELLTRLFAEAILRSFEIIFARAGLKD